MDFKENISSSDPGITNINHSIEEQANSKAPNQKDSLVSVVSQKAIQHDPTTQSTGSSKPLKFSKDEITKVALDKSAPLVKVDIDKMASNEESGQVIVAKHVMKGTDNQNDKVEDENSSEQSQTLKESTSGSIWDEEEVDFGDLDGAFTLDQDTSVQTSGTKVNSHSVEDDTTSSKSIWDDEENDFGNLDNNDAAPTFGVDLDAEDRDVQNTESFVGIVDKISQQEDIKLNQLDTTESLVEITFSNLLDQGYNHETITLSNGQRVGRYDGSDGKAHYFFPNNMTAEEIESAKRELEALGHDLGSSTIHFVSSDIFEAFLRHMQELKEEQRKEEQERLDRQSRQESTSYQKNFRLSMPTRNTRIIDGHIEKTVYEKITPVSKAGAEILKTQLRNNKEQAERLEQEKKDLEKVAQIKDIKMRKEELAEQTRDKDIEKIEGKRVGIKKEVEGKEKKIKREN